MVYAGLEPRVISCGNRTFGEELNLQDACKSYKYSLSNEFCAEKQLMIEAQFESLAYEVKMIYFTNLIYLF